LTHIASPLSDLSSLLPRAVRRGLTAAGIALALLVAGPGAAVAQPVASAAEIERQYRGGEPQLALLRLEQALAQRPADAPLRFLQAVLAGESGQTAEAQRLLERMTQEFPDLPEPYNNLAVLHAADGRLDQARGLLETALRLDPAYRVAHENLGDVFVRLAQRAYEAASGPRAGPGLQSKLRLVRELSALR
jgi:Flp pilus assembly protein TadD